jgi:SNF2 family DNA or RNA helicase
MLSKGTIEDKIDAIINSKTELFNNVIGDNKKDES